MTYYGNFKRGSVIRHKFNTFNQSLVPAAPSVALNFAVYKNSTTEFVTGVTPTSPFDGLAGVHLLTIDTSDAVYAVGEDYDVVFTAGTVDGIDLTRTKLFTFSIENRLDEANVIKIAGQTANADSAVTFPGTIASPTNITQATGVVLSSAGVQAIWDFLTSGILVAGSIGKQIVDRLDATISSRSTYAGTDTPGTTTLLGLITPQRALNLDFLDAASSSILSSITGLNNLSAKCNLFGSALLEVPEAGSIVYAFDLVVKDDEDKLVNLDVTPTITATNAAGTNRSANLSAVTSPGTGRYRFTYTVASTHAKESLRIEATGTVSAEARYAIWNGSTVDYDTTSTLVAIQNNTVDIQSRIPTALVNGRIASYVGELAPSVITSSSIATSALNGKGDWALATNWTATRAGYLDGVLLAHNYNIRVVDVTGSRHVAADIHESQVGSIHPTSLEAGVYTTIVSTLLGTNHTSYTTPGTVGQSLNGITTLLARIPSATAQLVTDLALMLVGSGTALVKWTVNALSNAPAGGGGGTIVATVAVPQLLEHTAFELDEVIVYRGCHWSFQVQNLGNLGGYTEIWFTLRKRQDDKQSNSALHISLTEGLIIANKSTTVTASDASLTVSGQNVTIQAKQAVTQFIEPGENYNYDLKGRNAAGQTIMLHESDKFIVKRDVTRKVS